MYKIGDVIPVIVTGIQDYGIFVKVDDEYSGLIHVSEIDNKFIKDINKYVKENDMIYASIINVDEENKLVIVVLVDNSKEQQEWFQKNIVNSKYLYIYLIKKYKHPHNNVRQRRGLRHDIQDPYHW